jgi:hypothetical protein
MDEFNEYLDWDDGGHVAVRGRLSHHIVSTRHIKRDHKRPAHKRFRRALRNLIAGGGHMRFTPLTDRDIW